MKLLRLKFFYYICEIVSRIPKTNIYKSAKKKPKEFPSLNVSFSHDTIVHILKSQWIKWMSTNKKAVFWNFDWFLSADMTKKETFKLGSSLVKAIYDIDWLFSSEWDSSLWLKCTGNSRENKTENVLGKYINFLQE